MLSFFFVKYVELRDKNKNQNLNLNVYENLLKYFYFQISILLGASFIFGSTIINNKYFCCTTHYFLYFMLKDCILSFSVPARYFIN